MREWGVESAFLLGIVKSARAVEELMLEVELTEPRPYALYLFASLPFFPWPRHVVEELGRDWRFAPTLVGNGPYRLLELDNSHVLLGASPTWRGSRGNLEEVRIRLGLRLEETKQLWRAGRFDLGFERPLDTGDESTIVWTTRPLDVLFVGLCAGRPPLDDLRVRQAVAHALDLAELFREDPDRELDAIGAGLIPPSLPAHSTGIALSHDPARARELLAEAGFGGAISLPPLRMLSEWRDDPGHGLARAVEQWDEAGITVEVEYALGAEFDEAIEERAHLVWSAWAADYPDPAGILDSLLERQPWIHREDRLVELLARARRSRDPDERWRIYREADRVLVQELVSVIPINHSKAVIVTRPWVEGVRFGPLHPPMFDELTIRRS
jgi:ABC-type transport system substrate-binding protein